MYEDYFEKIKKQQLDELEDIIDNKIFNAGLNILYIDGPENDPDLIIPARKVMIINRNSNAEQPVVYRKGHELHHYLEADPLSIEVYEYSPLCKRQEERSANEGAVQTFADILYSDLPNEARDWTKMIDLFNLPNWYDQIVVDAVYDNPIDLLNYDKEDYFD